MTLIVFNSHVVLNVRSPLAAAVVLDENTYKPDDCTALLDTIGEAVTSMGARLSAMPESGRPKKVIVAILTDGLANASQLYTKNQIAEMILQQQEVYSWEFIFLAANQDAFASGHAINIPAINTANVDLSSPAGVAAAYATASACISNYRIQPTKEQ